ncbi:MAG: pirin family protein [Spirochaetaceae bacterium]|nr:pirin family protein [Spirochaetaceae bacterium]
MSLGPIKSISRSQLVTDGDGVQINRVFGHGTTTETDPFLLLDHLINDDPLKPMNGFPWHPHRGIETITYNIQGGIQHEDSLGNKGVLRDGDVQWMTAGSGIIHQEMPYHGSGPLFHGFQLWANLPAEKKMMDPRYQDIPSGEIPEVIDDDGTKVKIITGTFRGKTGPVTGIVTDPKYIDITVPPHREKTLKINLDHHSFAYLFEGSGLFYGASSPIPAPTEYVTAKGVTEVVSANPVENRNLIIFDRGDEIKLKSGPEGMRFLLISGRPLKEPVAWHGPIVMNSRDELITAFQEYENGTFLKNHIQ